MIVKGDFKIYAGSYIRVIKDSKLIIHGGFINENVQITCGDSIEIGAGCAIGRDVIIRSYDGHKIADNDYKIADPIYIGNNVWIGENVVILPGTIIGDGCIVGANSVLNGKEYEKNTIIAGIPGKIIKKYNSKTKRWDRI